jgi:Rho-associated protein kinase 2
VRLSCDAPPCAFTWSATRHRPLAHRLHIDRRYAHRDIKPDNVLLDVRGHVKLGDFGTCIRVDDDGKVRSKSAVGTPDYISPEVLESQDSTKPYTVHCDWWSLGVMLYEFMCTDCPFYCDTLAGTYNKIQQHQPDKLTFPDGVEISDAGKDLMTRLLARKSERIGTKGGCDEIRSHPFFECMLVPTVSDRAAWSNCVTVVR